MSDADLIRLGVDPQILPLVRLLTSDAHLEALQAVLPEAQYMALFALACGMTSEEAWTEVAQLLPADKPPAQVDTGDNKVLHCPRCGTREPVPDFPLFIVTGASGAGKTTIAHAIALNGRVTVLCGSSTAISPTSTTEAGFLGQ